MEIAIRPANRDFKVGDPPQPVGDRRLPGRKLAAVADDDRVAGQPLGVCGDESGQGLAADLLFALDQVLQVDRQAAARLDPCPSMNRWVSIWPLSSVAPRA